MSVFTSIFKIAKWVLAAFLCLAIGDLFGQVKFKVELLPDGETYRVSMLSMATWSPPQNLVSTAQVAVRVPTGGFSVSNFTNLQSGVYWSQNARYNTPSEAPGYDYISFGLTSLGTTGLSFLQGAEVHLFSFKNSGNCTGAVEIMANEDPFFPPNSVNANVNNQMTILGMGQGSNGFQGAYDRGRANCTGCTVEYELEVLPNGLYQVSMIPYVTWNFPLNITSTAQVTVVAPTGGFYVSNLTNLLPNVVFHDNVRVNSPVENPGFDYISFGLQSLGTQGIPYQQGVKVPLFTFQNGGICTGPTIRLMDTGVDPFSPPNSLSSNAGQQLTTFGSTPDAPICIVQPGIVPCNQATPNVLNAVDDVLTGYINQPVSGNVTVNDLNPNNATLMVDIMSIQNPANGSVTLSANGSFIYQPAPGFIGIDQFKYRVCTSNLPVECDIATVTITIAPPFYAIDDEFTTSLNQPVSGQVLTNDPNPAAANLIVTTVPNAGPLNGTVSMNANGNFIYTPNPGYVGIDVFTYQLCDNMQYHICDTAKVTIYVTPAVYAIDDAYYGLPNQPLNANLRLNDLFLANYPSTIALLPGSGPANGSLVLQPNGSFNYQPNNGFIGTDIFGYILCQNSGSLTVCDTAHVSIYLMPGVTAIDDNYSTPAGVSFTADFKLNDQLPSSGFSNIAILPSSTPLIGSLILNPNNTFTYQPAQGFVGIESFQYSICDNQPTINCDTATVTITVLPRIMALDDIGYVGPNGAASGNVLSNDLNPNGNPLTVSQLAGTGPFYGSLVLNPNGTYNYVPYPNFNGMDMFQYIACDNVNNSCDTAKVTITVPSVLMANDDYFNAFAGNSNGSDVTLNDILPQGQSIIASIVPSSGPQNGMATMQPNGQVAYQANPGFIGTDYFDYKICLANTPNVCDTARVYVSSYNSAPPTPIVACPTKICNGEQIVLSVLQQYVGNSVEYKWVNASGQLVDIGRSLTLSSTSPLAVPPFRAIVTVDGLQSDYSPACELEILEAPQAIATNNGPICAGGTVQLSATAGSGYRYEWRLAGQPSILSTLQNPVFSNLLINANYELTVTSEGCTNHATTTTTVIVQPSAGITNINGGGTFCHGSEVILSALNSAASAGNLQYTWTGPNGFYFTSSAPASGPFPLTISTLVPENEGAYTLSLVTHQGCASQPQSVIVDYLPKHQAPNLTTSSQLVCQGESLTLNASQVAGNQVSYTWYFIGANGVVQTLQSTQFPTLQITNLNATHTGNYFVEVTVDGCTSEPSNLQAVTVASANLSIVASNSTTAASPACEGEGVQFSVPILPGASYHWYGPGGFFANQPNPFIANVSEDNAGDYLLVVNLPGCNTAVPTQTTVYVNPMPSTPLLLNNGPACAGNDLTLTISNASPGATYLFYEKATGLMIDSTAFTYTTLVGVSPALAGEYFVVASQNGCTSPPSNASMVEVETPPANIADAGQNIVLCEVPTACHLAATPPSIGTGLWSSPTGAAIINPDQPGSLVNGLSLGENLFVWALNDGACLAFSVDTMVVTLEDLPNDLAIAGPDHQHCGAVQIQLSALAPTTAIGHWTQPMSQITAGVFISDPSSISPIVTGLKQGHNYVFNWSLSHGACTDYSTDEVLISIFGLPPFEAMVAEDMLVVCDENNLQLVAAPPGTATGQWTASSAANIANPFSSITIASNLAEGENQFVWTLSTPDCPNYSADTMLVYSPALNLSNDSFYVEANSILSGVLLVNNDQIWLPDGWELEVVTQPFNGTVTYLGDGEISYEPLENAFGTDHFIYRICSEDCPEICEMATVKFNIGQSNVAPSDCFIPNTITPNGDDENDVLRVPCTTAYPGSSLQVFNRWGDIVFQTDDYQNDWGGTFKGEDIPVGTYFYLLKLNDPDQTLLSGYVVVWR